MTKKSEDQPRYRHIPMVDRAVDTPETLKGIFWVVCPEHGVSKAEKVVQWTRALSKDMHHTMDAQWFIGGRYTSGNCSTCGMTLAVTRRKPSVL